jgi:diketogulonate reductase-like aldo/keto reductase
MEEILESFEIKYIDLLQINIEGEEYRLLEKLISNGLVNRFKNIQVQFHTGIEDYEARREKIKDGLVKNGFLLSFEFPFIWEGWAKS